MCIQTFPPDCFTILPRASHLGNCDMVPMLRVIIKSFWYQGPAHIYVPKVPHRECEGVKWDYIDQWESNSIGVQQ